MLQGKVKFFNSKNKFGFIVESKTGREFYVHIKDADSPLEEGDEVAFEIAERKKGPVAVSVHKKDRLSK